MKVLALLIFAVFGFQKSTAQTFPACPPGQVTTAEECPSACIVCNFNGFSSSNIGSYPSSVPVFCGSIENDQWLAVIASAETMFFDIAPSNCTLGNGMQIALYAECGGQPISCNAGCSGCGNTVQQLGATGLIPGQIYLLLLDGWAGDECDFTVSVSSPGGSTNPTTVQISGPATVCPGEKSTYFVDQLLTSGQWSVNGATSFEVSPGGTSVEIVWPQTGGGSVIFGDDCLGMGNLVVSISEPPVADFSTLPAPSAGSQPLIICKGQPVHFQNESLGAVHFE